MEAARKELDIALLYFRFMQTICWSIVDFQRSVLSGCSHLIHLLPTQTGYLFCWGFFCHRSYDPRRTSQVPCAEYHVLVEYLLHTQSSVDMVEIQMSVEGRYRFLWEGVILVGYLLQIHISVFMLILTS